MRGGTKGPGTATMQRSSSQKPSAAAQHSGVVGGKSVHAAASKLASATGVLARVGARVVARGVEARVGHRSVLARIDARVHRRVDDRGVTARCVHERGVETRVLRRRVAAARARDEGGRERHHPSRTARTRPRTKTSFVAHAILGGTKGPGTATMHCSPSQKPPGCASQHSCVVGGKIGGHTIGASLPESRTIAPSIDASPPSGVWLELHATSAEPRVTARAARRARARARRRSSEDMGAE